MKLYTYPTCATSRKARKFLLERNVRFDEVDLKNGLSASELDRLIGKRDPAQFFNPRHPLYKEKSVKTNPPGREETIRLLAAEPRAIRRPMLVAGRKIIFGFDAVAYEEVIS